jgi:hypothetical protein
MTHTKNPDSFYTPYLKEQYSWENYRYESFSISPNNKYFVIDLIDDMTHNRQLDLFEICESSESEPYGIKFCNTLLVLEPNRNNGSSAFDDIHLGYVWSASGYKLICEYQEKEDVGQDKYMIVYFDIYTVCTGIESPAQCNATGLEFSVSGNSLNNNYDYTPKPLFADDKYIWEHNMHFSADDNILVTVYNSEIMRVFEFDPINRNYIFKIEISMPSKIITTLYLTPDNKIIVSTHNSQTDEHVSCNSIIAYKLNDSLTGIIELLTHTLPATELIFKNTAMTHNNTKYLVYYLSDGVGRNTRFVYLYNLTKIRIQEIIDLHEYNVSLYSLACNDYMIVRNNTTHKLEQFNLISKKISSIPLTLTARDFMYTCENSLDNSRNFVDAKFKVYHSSWDCNSKQAVYQLFDYSDTQYSKYRHKHLTYLHNTENYIIYQIRINQTYKLCIGNSLQFCYDKNINIVTQLLSDYMPIELYYKVASYIK